MRVRMARPEDAEAMLAIYAPIVRESGISFEVTPPPVAEFAERIARTLPEHPWLAAENDGGIDGYAYAARYRTRPAYAWSAEVSVYVDPRRRRHGVARELYRALLSLLAVQGVHRALAVITLPNPASVAMHERLGFTPAGVLREAGWKLGRWHDVGFWEREVASHDGPPAPPRALAQLTAEEVRVCLEHAGG